jgi:hypothetical protein
MADTLPIPVKLAEFSQETRVTNYFKQMHDKIEELEERVKALENP